MPLSYITRKYIRDFKNFSIFIQFSLVSVMLSRRAQRTQKALRKNTSKTYNVFRTRATSAKWERMHSPLYWFRGRIQKILITGIQLVHIGEANRDLKQGRRQWQCKRRWKKWICVLSNLIASIWTRSICQMQATFPGVEFLRILFGFKKRKENSSSYVHVLHKNGKLGGFTS